MHPIDVSINIKPKICYTENTAARNLNLPYMLLLGLCTGATFYIYVRLYNAHFVFIA